MKKIINFILDCTCILCGTHLSDNRKYICNNCFNVFIKMDNKGCKVCRHPLNTFGICNSCNQLGKIYFDSYKTVQYYTEYFKNIIYKLKKDENFLIIKLFAELIIYKQLIDKNNIITVVPDTFCKKIRKGRSSLNYLLTCLKNNGYKIARDIYKRKIVFNDSQKNKDKNKRFNDIKKMYYLPKKAKNKYSGKVYLIDDVYTTGATINYGAKLLKEAGFSEVIALTFFRAVLDNS